MNMLFKILMNTSLVETIVVSPEVIDESVYPTRFLNQPHLIRLFELAKLFKLFVK